MPSDTFIYRVIGIYNTWGDADISHHLKSIDECVSIDSIFTYPALDYRSRIAIVSLHQRSIVFDKGPTTGPWDVGDGIYLAIDSGIGSRICNTTNGSNTHAHDRLL